MLYWVLVAWENTAKLAKKKSIIREKYKKYFLEIITCEASIYTMDYRDFIVCRCMENFIVLKIVNYYVALTQQQQYSPTF